MNARAGNRSMRKILTIADSYPSPDQASGDLRFFTLLSLMAREYEVVFCALNAGGTVKARDEAGVPMTGESAGGRVGWRARVSHVCCW